MHHAAPLLALALATNRTLVLSFKDWRYDDEDERRAGKGEGAAGMGGGGGAVMVQGVGSQQQQQPQQQQGAAAGGGMPGGAPSDRAPSPPSAFAGGGGGGAWETAFLPITPCPLPPDWEAAPGLDPRLLPGQAAHRVVRGGIIDAGASPADPPAAMPPDVFALVSSFNARPEVWWVGALQAYLMRPAPGAVARRAAFDAAHGLAPSWEEAGEGKATGSASGATGAARRPYVAVHVRRTDKVEGAGAEAAAHGVDEYLGAAAAVAGVWRATAAAAVGGSEPAHPAAPATTRTLAAVTPTRGGDAAGQPASSAGAAASARLLVYLATDDAAVLAQARAAHPGVDFVADEAAASSAALAARNSRASLAGIVDDVERLAGGAWLVGTFSSQVSRLAYELAQVRAFPASPGIDPAFRATSVDSGWYYGGGGDVPFVAEAALGPASWAGANPRQGAGDDRTAGGVAPGGRLACSPLAGHRAGAGILSCRRAATPDNAWQNEVDAPAALIRRCAVEEAVFPRLLRDEVAARAGRGEV
jgi:hypothetical protein